MKRLSVILILSLALLPLSAQNAASCFKAMPDSLCPLLSAVNRADCIDFLESKMKAEVTNTFGKKSEMTHLANDYIAMRMTPQSTWQMKILPTNDSTKVICTVSTVCATLCDSHIRFYSTDWQRELPLADFLPPLPTSSDEELMMQAELAADAQTLTLTLSPLRYKTEEESREQQSVAPQQIVYRWKEGKFE